MLTKNLGQVSLIMLTKNSPSVQQQLSRQGHRMLESKSSVKCVFTRDSK